MSFSERLLAAWYQGKVENKKKKQINKEISKIKKLNKKNLLL